MKLKKKDLVSKIHETSDISKVVIAEIVDEVFATIIDELIAGNEINIAEFGTFKLSTRPAYEGNNPRTGEPMHVKERKMPTCRFSRGTSVHVNDEFYRLKGQEP